MVRLFSPLHQKGFGLIESLLSLSIISAFFVAFWNSNSQQVRSMKYLENRSDLISVFNTIRALTDCSATVTASTACPQTGNLNLLKASGETLISSGGTSFGRLTFRARCTAGNDGIVIESAMLKPSLSSSGESTENFHFDKERGVPYDWNHPNNSLGNFQEIPLCREQEGSSSSITSTGLFPHGHLLAYYGHWGYCGSRLVDGLECYKRGNECISGVTTWVQHIWKTSKNTSHKYGGCSCRCDYPLHWDDSHSDIPGAEYMYDEP